MRKKYGDFWRKRSERLEAYESWLDEKQREREDEEEQSKLTDFE